ncbi:EAL domain-containing protein [Euhalothece natronophila Z-M001]|uniref:EAL domain-containing protein n=1 Tax=Euhalothece natronophila Z-M001 TaxID=522448 RepID=A0A5B8NN04_9CHRO|nr:EAL domain-containing protein [Euhalothece natronophila]QDZ40693.1 EAL domain-containing protein [Euhalothece natronophila Z-M001]
MLQASPIWDKSSPIILVINRQGKCLLITSNLEQSTNPVQTNLSTLFSQKTLEKIQNLTTKILEEQTPQPLVISQQSDFYFSYLFPLSLASVLLIAQPLQSLSIDSTQKAINIFPIPMLLYKASNFQIKAVNQVAIDHYGYSEAKFLGMKFSDLHPYQNIPYPLQDVSQLTRGEWQHYRQDGKLISLEVIAYPLNLRTEKLVLLAAQDITAKYTQTALEKKQDADVKSLFPPFGILCFDQNWNYTLAVGEVLNQLTPMTMTERGEAITGKSFSELFSPELKMILQSIQSNILRGHYQTQWFQYSQYTYYIQGYPLINQNKEIKGGLLMLQNLTQNKKLEALINHHAFRDPATHLPNKTWLLEQIRHQIKVDGEFGVAVILVNLERYSVVKYGFGPEIAEKLISAVAKRLKQTLPINCDFARVGDSTIAAIILKISQQAEVEKLAQLIHCQLSLPLNIAGQELFCPVSVGVSIYDQNSETGHFLNEPRALLHAADTAMNAARGEGKLSCVVFHPYLHHSAVTRVQLETELRRALRLKQLHVFYQPTVSIANGKLVGFEALVRWQHPEKGLVSPNQFMPLAEELGLIGFIDWWVLAEACEKLAAWQQMIPEGEFLSMNVNLSENMINQVGVLERLEQIINRTGIAPRSLKLEVTEGIILEGETATLGILKQLQQMGVLLSIDDFGTGYSSLQRLHQLPINTLKVDRSFTKRMLKAPEIMQIVKTIISLAHNLNMDVIAEGIETERHWETLQELGCEYGQGFLFGKALPETAIQELIVTHQTDLIIK